MIPGFSSLSYDFENRVTSVTLPGGGTNSYTYNGLDTRVSKVDSGGTRSFMRDGVGVTAPVLSDSAAVYTPGVSERRSGVTTYEHSGIKNASLQTSTAQAVTASRTYDAFGNVASSTGSWSGPFGYAGQFGYQEDPDTGLKLLGHRYYDSSTGRFLSRDKVKDGRNWYGYCDGNPTNSLDFDGLNKLTLTAGYGFIIPFLAGHASADLSIDENFEVQVGVNVGGGTGMGISLPEPWPSVSGGVSHEELGPDHGFEPEPNTTIGLAAGALELECDVDGKGRLVGGSSGDLGHIVKPKVGEGTDHGVGAGVYAERKIRAQLNLTHWIVDRENDLARYLFNHFAPQIVTEITR